MRHLIHRARRKPARVVFPEGHNDTVIRAASQMVDEGVARPILLGRPHRVHEKADALGISMDGVEIVYAAESDEDRRRWADRLFQKRGRKGLTLSEARWNMYKPVYFAASMVESGEADTMVAGIEANYGEILRPSLEVVGVAEGVRKVSGLYMLAFPNRDLLFLADTTVNIDPDVQTLADIALQTATFVRELNMVPRVAMVSFSNFGSARHPESEKMAQAVRLRWTPGS